jgi:hypothetical protein
MNPSGPASINKDVSVGFVARVADRRWTAAVTLLALGGAGVVLLATARYGAGITTDSIAYLDVARNLVAGKGFVLHTEGPLIWWPPLYPLLLAFIGFATGLDPAVFAHLVNAVLFAIAIYLSARLFHVGLRQRTAYGMLGVGAVVLSVPLSEIYAMTWSECLFIPLVLLYLVFVQRYRESRGMLSLAVMTLATALACLTRYIGVALVPVGVLTILLARGIRLRTRFARASAFAALSLVPLGLWVVRNYQQAGTLSGELLLNVILLATKVLAWYEPVGLAVKLAPASVVPDVKSASLSANLFVALAVIIALAVALSLSRMARKRLSSSLRAVLSDHTPVVLFLAVYSIALLALAMRGASSAIDSRLASPVFVPLTVVLLNVAYDLLGPSRTAPNFPVSRMPTMLLALWLCFPLASTALATARRFRNGAGGYSIRSWHESETVTYARRALSAHADVRVYSNGPDALWALARVNADWPPDRTQVNLDSMKGRWPPDTASVVVWFDNIDWRKHLFSVEELGRISNIEEVALFSDGSVYRVTARRTAVREPDPRNDGAAETDAAPQPAKRPHTDFRLPVPP